MKLSRLQLVLLLLVLVLIGLCLAWSLRKNESSVEEWTAWARGKVGARGGFDPGQVRCPEKRGSVIVLPKLAPALSAEIEPAPHGFLPSVRTLRLVLSGIDTFQLTYEPASSNGVRLDPRAVPTQVGSFEPGKTNSLLVLEHGGHLALRRKSSRADASFKIE